MPTSSFNEVLKDDRQSLCTDIQRHRYKFFFQVAIGSWDCLSLLWLARVISFTWLHKTTSCCENVYSRSNTLHDTQCHMFISNLNATAFRFKPQKSPWILLFSEFQKRQKFLFDFRSHLDAPIKRKRERKVVFFHKGFEILKLNQRCDHQFWSFSCRNELNEKQRYFLLVLYPLLVIILQLSLAGV